MSKRAAIYARISKDDGTALGVQRQITDCTTLIDRSGWALADTYIDNDVSATRSKIRPAYRRLLTDVEAGRINAVAVWDVDRLTRTPSELEHIIDLANRHHVALASVGGDIDLATEQGRLTARIKGNVARYETEQMSRRIRNEQQTRALRGDPHGQAGYGYRREYDYDDAGRRIGVRQVIDPAPAAVIREAARRVLSGDSLRSTVTSLNAQGHLSPKGLPWESATLRQVLLRASNAGLRRHQGQVIGDANWEPILERAVWEQLVLVLRDPSRRTVHDASVKHLLSGIASCGLCGSRMVVNMGRRQSPAYICRGCYKVRRVCRPVENYVTASVMRQLSDPVFLASLTVGDGVEVTRLHGEKAALVARKGIAADAFADGAIDDVQLKRISSRLDADIKVIDRQLEAVLPGPDLTDLTTASTIPWGDYTVERQRAILRAITETIVIEPALTRGRPAQDMSREVTITWR